MKHLFVPYDIALALKEIGFDEPCFAFFKYKEFKGIWQDEMNPCCNSEIADFVTAPLYDQIIDWFIEKHQLNIESIVSIKYWICRIYDLTVTHKGSGGFTFFTNQWQMDNEFAGYASRKEALNAGILKAIELIKQQK